MTYKPSWDEIWMSLAKNISLRSHSPTLKVGSVIVTSDNESVLSLGYNGGAIGDNNLPDSLEPGQSGFIHAECNAIAKMNYNDHRVRKMYLTHNPCRVCAKLIINAKIQKLYYCEEYRDTSGLFILQDRGIIVEKCKFWE